VCVIVCISASKKPSVNVLVLDKAMLDTRGGGGFLLMKKIGEPLLRVDHITLGHLSNELLLITSRGNSSSKAFGISFADRPKAKSVSWK
jgi:hypothetical protein